MGLATSGKTQVLMTLFMMWMIGNNISLILMLIICQGLYTTIKAIIDVNKSSHWSIQHSTTSKIREWD